MRTTGKTMKSMKSMFQIAWAGAWLAIVGTSAADESVIAAGSDRAAAREGVRERALVQIAILLDTSGSMKGLIEQTKGQIWKIVNEFVFSTQNGQRPDLEIALFEYGNNRLEKDDGWIRRIQPLTTDLDKISEELFALSTNGGKEYCGWVVREAVRQLDWTAHPDAYKAIFIAGNEPFTQGPVDFRESCRDAIQRGIIVNTIHCGAEGVGIETGWRNGALAADGHYMVINHNEAVVHFEAPQDAEIARLGEELNKTYIAFGALGSESQLRQTREDSNSIVLATQGASVNRALFKASPTYCNAHWDLVDACREGKVVLEDLSPDQLPPELKGKTPAQCREFIDAKAVEREAIQKEIQALNEERKRFVSAAAREQAGDNTLDHVMISVIREQARKQAFVFEQ